MHSNVYALQKFPNLIYNMAYRLLRANFVLHIWVFTTAHFVHIHFSLVHPIVFLRVVDLPAQRSRRGSCLNAALRSASFLEDDINIKNSKWILIFFFFFSLFPLSLPWHSFSPHVTAYSATHTSLSILRDLRFCLSHFLPYMNLFLLPQCPAAYSYPLLTFWWFSYGR